MRYLIHHPLVWAMTAGLFLTACGSQERGTLAGPAVEPTGSDWINSWTTQVEQNPAQDVGAQDLAGTRYQELLADWRSQQAAEESLAQAFHAAAPPIFGPEGKAENVRWLLLKAGDLSAFAEDACHTDAAQAARDLVAKLPGLTPAHAPLLDQTMQLIPRHCTVVNPAAVDAASSVLFTTVFRRGQAQRAETPTASPAPAPVPMPSRTADQLHYKAVCGMGSALGGYFTGRAEAGKAKAFGLVALAGAVVYCPGALKDLFG
ncbi:hypothetical protein EF910_00065 [Streptomyces sp. WAC07149]|uniref:hypothetical protein n=1 Tax=Streptomyces sp. WAC07149 TaxID=2487425 RepID=UPI000F79FED2|nr:hypothetical protein [Streptomyces sp. WAC07149]RST08687.1 hypothetical protein EF910_00065 [Streptomyces sp. WAC07149]